MVLRHCLKNCVQKQIYHHLQWVETEETTTNDKHYEKRIVLVLVLHHGLEKKLGLPYADPKLFQTVM